MGDRAGGDMIVRRMPGLIEAEVDGELIGLHVDNGTCYGFNPTATRIWALIEQPTSLSALCDRLVETYEVPPQTCRAEVTALLEELRADGLVELSPAAAE